jgi:hypothetical protein
MNEYCFSKKKKTKKKLSCYFFGSKEKICLDIFMRGIKVLKEAYYYVAKLKENDFSLMVCPIQKESQVILYSSLLVYYLILHKLLIPIVRHLYSHVKFFFFLEFTR